MVEFFLGTRRRSHASLINNTIAIIIFSSTPHFLNRHETPIEQTSSLGKISKNSNIEHNQQILIET